MRASVESVIRSVERDYSPIHWILKPELDLALKLANQIDNQETLDSKLVHECRMILASIRKQVLDYQPSSKQQDQEFLSALRQTPTSDTKQT